MTTDDILGLYFWDTIIQQQQQQLDQISQDYHENNPHHNVIKDDVFLAQPTSILEYYDDVSSESSSIITSPPTQFLSQPLLDIFGTDIMLPALEPESPLPTLKKRRKKSSTIEPVLVKKQKRDSQLIEPIITKDGNKTVFQQLTEQSIDWCRYCGTTEGVNWRPGPWGKRTLCNKHGCDYKGYGLASRLPRLDLSLFTNEKLQDRKRPVIQHFCSTCQSPESDKDNALVVCEGGCSRAYHQQCHNITVNPAKDDVRWYCTAACKENAKRNKVVVELPRKHIPLMHLLKK